MVQVIPPATGHNLHQMGIGLKIDYDRLAYEIHQEFNGERVLFLPVGYHGFRDFEDYVRVPLTRKGVRFYAPQSPLEQVDASGDEYRPITTEAKSDMNRRHAKVAIPFDNNVVRGTGILGGLVWTLKNAGTLGIERVYTGAVTDWLGVTNFHAIGGYDEYIGMKRFIEEEKPETMAELDNGRLLDMLSDHTPAADASGYVAINVDNSRFERLRNELLQRVDGREILYMPILPEGRHFGKKLLEDELQMQGIRYKIATVRYDGRRRRIASPTTTELLNKERILNARGRHVKVIVDGFLTKNGDVVPLYRWLRDHGTKENDVLIVAYVDSTGVTDGLCVINQYQKPARIEELCNDLYGNEPHTNGFLGLKRLVARLDPHGYVERAERDIMEHFSHSRNGHRERENNPNRRFDEDILGLSR